MNFIREIAPVCRPKGYASHFEGNADDAFGLAIEAVTIQELCDGHEMRSPLRRERDRSLSHRRLAAAGDGIVYPYSSDGYVMQATKR
jgi:hypothetical protein